MLPVKEAAATRQQDSRLVMGVIGLRLSRLTVILYQLILNVNARQSGNQPTIATLTSGEWLIRLGHLRVLSTAPQAYGI